MAVSKIHFNFIFSKNRREYGTASSGKHAFLMQRGLHEAIDYRTKDWSVDGPAHQWKRRGAHHRSAGGNHWKKSYKALRSTGRLGMFGISVVTTSKLSGPLRLLPVALGMPLFHPLSLMNTNKSAFGVNLGHMWHETDMIAGWMEILLKGVADGWVRPRGQELLARAGRRGANLSGRAQEHRQGNPDVRGDDDWLSASAYSSSLRFRPALTRWAVRSRASASCWNVDRTASNTCGGAVSGVPLLNGGSGAYWILN